MLPTPKVYLHFQGLRIDQDPETGVRILAGGKNLVLQGIQRHHSGNYTCTAFNLEGEDTSNPVPVTVMCKFYKIVLIVLSINPFQSIQANWGFFSYH